MSESAVVEFELAGERLLALPQRALYWPARKELIIADMHLGKSAAFRAQALPVPSGTTGNNLARLSLALERTGAQRLVILGDAVHAREGYTPELNEAVLHWRERHDSVHVLLIRGNHDRRSGDPPESWGFECRDEPVIDSPFEYSHSAKDIPNAYTLCGHLHPTVRLEGPGRDALTLPCLWIRAHHAILPAFGSFTGGWRIQPARNERAIVFHDDGVAEV